MNRYEWLSREIEMIQTPRFHVVHDTWETGLTIPGWDLLPVFPEAYVDFVANYGGARLYRTARNNSYYIGIFSKPRLHIDKALGKVLWIGFLDGDKVIALPNRRDDEEFNMALLSVDGVRNMNLDFDEWLFQTCGKARLRYTKREWDRIIRGPMPFTQIEIDMLSERRRIVWSHTGATPEGDQELTVENHSKMRFSKLTIGVQSKDGRLNGAAWVDISSIAAGAKGRVTIQCYKGLVDPSLIQLFNLPDPQPEDREFFAEFKSTSPHSRRPPGGYGA